MKIKKSLVSCLLSLVSVAAFAASEGTPTYYQQQAAANNRNARGYYRQGYSNYVGQSGGKQVVAQNVQTYAIERPAEPSRGAMTLNGVAETTIDDSRTSIWANYTRRFADFEFRTGVNSVLHWDDMILNEVTVGAQHIFNLRNVDIVAFGQYGMGMLGSAGISMDYDLEPYDYSQPNVGIFTISAGGASGDTSRLKFGIGAKNVWDLSGWKITPSIGYEIFKHNLQMSDHIYPNQGVYVPLMTAEGAYVFGDGNGNYFSVAVDQAAAMDPNQYYQVCMSPEDMKVVTGVANGALTISDWSPTAGYETKPWDVGAGECVVIGGDGMIKVEGTTHIYNTTWSGFYIGLELEKQMTLADKLRFYVQASMPKYSSAGTWPKRTDWQQNPSFIDEGSSGAYAYRAEIEYTYKMSNRLQLSIGGDFDYFHVGKIGGELYIAEYTTWTPIEQTDGTVDWQGVTTPAHTEQISDSLKYAYWRSFGMRVGLKYAF